MRHIYPLILFVLLIGASDSFAVRECSESYPQSGETYPEYYSRSQRRHCEKEWTVMIYMEATSDLERFAAKDLFEMENKYARSHFTGSNSSKDVLVHVSLESKKEVSWYHMFQGNRTRLESPITSPRLRNFVPDGKAAPGRKLYEFLEWAAKEYPSKNTMIILWSHGNAWTSRKSRLLNGDLASGGILVGQGNSTYLSIPSLRGVLRAISKNILKRPFDIFISDACLMQTVEVARELSDEGVVKYIVGSPQLQTAENLPFYRLIPYMTHVGELDRVGATNLATPVEKLSFAIPEFLYRSLTPQSSRQGRAEPSALEYTVISSYRAAAMAPLARSLNLLGSYLNRNWDFLTAANLENNLALKQRFAESYVDLGVLLQAIDELDARAASATARVRMSIAQALVNVRYGKLYKGHDIKGLSIWYPSIPENRLARLADFRKSLLYKDAPEWSLWMERK